jgi:lipopolysaccharide export system protein LptC
MSPDEPDTLRAPFRSAAPSPPQRALDRLLRSEKGSAAGARGYTKFVRAMRLVLPLLAVGIVGIVVSWPRVEERMTAPPVVAPEQQTVGQNELINPRFESQDSQSQPYTVTAARAVQSSANPDIVFLEKPVGDINLSDGAWIAAEAQKGAFDQKAQTLVLEGAVKLFHDKGYEMKTEKLLVDMAARTAFSDVAVAGQGPAGTLVATGLKADNMKGQVIFTGPVTLTLNSALEGL